MKKVLVADSNVDITSLLEIKLGRSFEVVTAHSSEQAVEVAKDNPDISIVFLNTECLGQGGIVTVLKGLCANCKVILHSGSLVGDEDPALYGVDAIIPKAEDPDELLEFITELTVS